MRVSKSTNSHERAFALRRLGFTFSEIASDLKVSKGAISKWLKGVKFSVEEMSLIAAKVAKNNLQARQKSRLSKQLKRVFAERQVLIEAKKDFQKFKKNTLFISGLTLYWAHGSFTNPYFQFTSSNEEMLQLILEWLGKYLGVKENMPKYRVFSTNWGNEEALNAVWVKELSLTGRFMKPVIIKKSQNIAKNALNKGSLQIVVPGIERIRKIKVWQKLFVRYYQDDSDK